MSEIAIAKKYLRKYSNRLKPKDEIDLLNDCTKYSLSVDNVINIMDNLLDECR